MPFSDGPDEDDLLDARSLPVLVGGTKQLAEDGGNVGDPRPAGDEDDRLCALQVWSHAVRALDEHGCVEGSTASGSGVRSGEVVQTAGKGRVGSDDEGHAVRRRLGREGREGGRVGRRIGGGVQGGRG